ncbi:cysteine-tryptophan domain-containing zinc finger protein 7-like [Gossypium arboreum]|uniref:cysteine-tryptophan domain-containing zinc finger protein 7-like n=1 Tax=Gossypium arboreum TaxID=29729 RepID=UPI0022F19C92|nr:cysteine-tryptophan domain-containing zinc finger protein 7-like [Gossypium arboreum]
MISLGSNDARKGLKFAGREMEETELEEGEACSYSNNNDDYDATTDTENDLSSLSYIDEKIQHVLGHFQKDFEGGVSAENLGAKFGGYGSFLPTYTRSPGWPHPNSSPKVQSWHAPRSPPKMPLEVVFSQFVTFSSEIEFISYKEGIFHRILVYLRSPS